MFLRLSVSHSDQGGCLPLGPGGSASGSGVVHTLDTLWQTPPWADTPPL